MGAWRLWVVSMAVVAAACATAGEDPDAGGGDVDAAEGTPDASVKPPADASTEPDAKPSPPDAAPLPDSPPGTPDAAPPPDAPPPPDAMVDAAPPPDAMVDAAPGTPDAAPLPDAPTGDCIVSGIDTFSNTTSTPIADSATTTSTITVSGVDPFLARIAINTSITHTYSADLDITLISPAGTRVLITSDNGGSNNDVFNGTLWSDVVNTPVTDYTFTDGTAATQLTPESAMSAFVGENPNGTWTLEIVDDLGADTGTLAMWSIELAGLPSAPTFASTPFTSSAPVALPDLTTTNATLSVSGATTELCDIHLTTAITHTYSGDLDLALISPTGTRVVLSTDNAGSENDVFDGTLWDDTANAPISEHTFTDGVTSTPLTAESALGAFIGENPNGTWTLEVDDGVGGDTGTLSSWTVDVVGCTCP